VLADADVVVNIAVAATVAATASSARDILIFIKSPLCQPDGETRVMTLGITYLAHTVGIELVETLYWLTCDYTERPFFPCLCA
jgi:hypothetical protein